MFFVFVCLIVMPDHLPQFLGSWMRFMNRPVHLPWVMVIVPPDWKLSDLLWIVLLLVAITGLDIFASMAMFCCCLNVMVVPWNVCFRYSYYRCVEFFCDI